MFFTAKQEVNHIVLQFNPLVIYSLICAVGLFPIVKYRWPKVFQIWRKTPKEAPSTQPDDDQIIQDSGRPWSVPAKRTKPKPKPTALTPQVEAKSDFMDGFINFFKNILMALILVLISPFVCGFFWVHDRRTGGRH
ncbi:hypothetical protein ACFFLI_01780 [Lactiplantibacillus modestisalitolerans]|uniref:Integral membrane protein n=2 Tax=Lactiplantibacillus modestisalitolerans TaxID=1457219 RepID=A0ABV5WR29_9LACO